ncbi:MAG: acyloxyacyl hydrolase [Herminiimonas sp.]|nr:acyloxyacyl hydrolase [Herminiimonas sp.]
MRLKPTLPRALLVIAASLHLSPSIAADSIMPSSYSAEFAAGNRTQAARVGAQWKWERSWWNSNGTRIGGYWDADIARWHGTRNDNIPDKVQNLWEIGVTPVFRFERDTGLGPYAEAGIGAHLLSAKYSNNGRQLSTHFQFGDHIGVGYVFSNRLDLGLRFQHFSNGGIEQPNSGVNFATLRASYAF